MSVPRTAELAPQLSTQSCDRPWTWTAPDAPIRIHIAPELIARLRAEIERGQERDEIGGVLLGCSGKTPATVEIQDFVCLPSQTRTTSQTATSPTRGQYRLDLAQMEQAGIARPDVGIVGYFRTQLEGALHLRRHELSFVTDHFHDPSNVVLLIRTSPDRFRGGFLFWDRGAFVPFSIQDFSFDRTAIETEVTQAFLPRTELPDIMQPAEQFGTPGPAETGQESHARRRLLIVCAGLLAVLGLSGFLLRDRLLSAPKLDIATQAPGVPVQLEAAAQGDALDIRWNPQSGPLTNAVEGHLTVVRRDGEPETITLDREKLSSGHMHYESSTQSIGDFAASAGKIEVRMELVDRAGNIDRESFSIASFPQVPESPSKVTPPAARTRVDRAVSKADIREATKPRVTQRQIASRPPDPATSRNVVKTAPARAPARILPLPSTSTFAERAANLSLAPPPVLASSSPVAAISLPDQPLSLPANAASVAPAVPAPKATAGAGRFAGAWTYPTSNGLYHGAPPEVVEAVIQEANGHLNGTVYARFKRSPSEPDRTLKFQFSGDLRAGRTQFFYLETSEGAKGTVELIPGTSPGLLEVNFTTASARGDAQTGNMILLKK